MRVPLTDVLRSASLCATTVGRATPFTFLARDVRAQSAVALCPVRVGAVLSAVIARCVMASEGDRAKLDFMTKALSASDPLLPRPKLCDNNSNALAWRKARTPERAMREREETVSHVEDVAVKLREQGLVEAWKRYDVGPKVRPALSFALPFFARRLYLQAQKVVRDANGPLCKWLAGRVGYKDSCVDLLAGGADLLGNLEPVGLGDEKSTPWVGSLSGSRCALGRLLPLFPLG